MLIRSPIIKLSTLLYSPILLTYGYKYYILSYFCIRIDDNSNGIPDN